MSTDGVLGAVWLPTDGWLDPSGLAKALAAGARARGAPIRTQTRVVAIGTRARPGDRRDGRARRRANARSAPTSSSNAGGHVRAGDRRGWSGVTVPIIPMAHQYLFTEPIEGVHPGLPQLRDPDNLVYFREEVGGLCMGGYERDPAPWSLDGIPPDFNGKLLAPDMAALRGDHGGRRSGASRRWPTRASTGSSTAPRRSPRTTSSSSARSRGPRVLRRRRVLGPRHRRRRRHRPPDGDAGSSTASPSSTSGRWTSGGSGRPIGSQAYTLARSIENYATYYDIHYPNEERQAGRPLRMAPTYEDRSPRSGASFGEKSGWERPNWFEPNAADRRRRRLAAARLGRASTGRPRSARRRWRRGEAAGLFDETSFAKLEIVGPGAVAFLQSLCANDIDRPVGSIVYTQLLNRRGGIECDLTVTRADGRPLPARHRDRVSGNHDLAWLAPAPARRRQRARSATSPRDACASALWGPRARDILAPLTRDDVSDAAFPYLTAREITVGSCRCSRCA